jgi:hypothetical protein
MTKKKNPPAARLHKVLKSAARQASRQNPIAQMLRQKPPKGSPLEGPHFFDLLARHNSARGKPLAEVAWLPGQSGHGKPPDSHNNRGLQVTRQPEIGTEDQANRLAPSNVGRAKVEATVAKGCGVPSGVQRNLPGNQFRVLALTNVLADPPSPVPTPPGRRPRPLGWGLGVLGGAFTRPLRTRT